MRRKTIVCFYVWAGEAGSLIEEAKFTMEEYFEDEDFQELQEIFRDDFWDDCVPGSSEPGVGHSE